MATPADQRLLELLDKWLESLELHLKYSALDDDSYWKIQPWQDHQRPSRWIIDLARQKAVALQKQIRERVDAGDATFCDSLELMAFLANLVGSEHIERFIPLANPAAERALGAAISAKPLETPSLEPKPLREAQRAVAPPADATATREMPKFMPDTPRSPARSSPPLVPHPERDAPANSTATREMPTFLPGTPRSPAPASTPMVTRTERKAPAAARPQAAAKPADAGKGAVAPATSTMHEQVIADAARLVQWGRKWYELAELISGMADRPSLIDVRRILQDNKTLIEKKAGRG